MFAGILSCACTEELKENAAKKRKDKNLRHLEKPGRGCITV